MVEWASSQVFRVSGPVSVSACSKCCALVSGRVSPRERRSAPPFYGGQAGVVALDSRKGEPKPLLSPLPRSLPPSPPNKERLGGVWRLVTAYVVICLFEVASVLDEQRRKRRPWGEGRGRGGRREGRCWWVGCGRLFLVEGLKLPSRNRLTVDE